MARKKYNVVCPKCLKGRFITYAQFWNIEVGNSSGYCVKCNPAPKNISGLELGRGWNRGIYGDKAHRWIADRTKLVKQNDRSTHLYYEWKKQIQLRDSLRCCINNKDCNGRIEIHHISRWKEHPELRFEVNNGITLCHYHHPRKKSEEAILSPYFTNLINNKTLICH